MLYYLRWLELSISGHSGVEGTRAPETERSGTEHAEDQEQNAGTWDMDQRRQWVVKHKVRWGRLRSWPCLVAQRSSPLQAAVFVSAPGET